MPKSKENTLQMKRAVVEEHNRHYVDGVTTYKGIWRRWIQPRFFISYNYYMDILSTPGLKDMHRGGG